MDDAAWRHAAGDESPDRTFDGNCLAHPSRAAQDEESARCAVGQHIGLVVEWSARGFAQVRVVPGPAGRVTPPAVGRRQNLLCLSALHGSARANYYSMLRTAQNVYILHSG